MQAASQTKYQVRFGWGNDGVHRVGAGAHLLVWVDVLPDLAERDADPLATLGADLPEIVRVGLADGRRVADRVSSLQTERGDRCVVAVIAAGGPAGAYAVEDQLGAGNVIDALVEIGIDHTSPEAAAACATWTGLARAAKHLVSASEQAIALQEAGHRDLVDRAVGRSAGEHNLRA